EMADRHDLALALQRMEKDGLSRVTYRDVAARAGACAARLAAEGIGKGDRVVLRAANHPDWAIAYFGVMRAGATAVPVDPHLDEEGFQNILRESGAKLVLDAQKMHAFAAEDAALVPPVVEIEPRDVASLI